MSLFEIIAVLFVLAAGFSYVNARFIKLPTVIGVMALAIVTSLVAILLNALGVAFVSDQLQFVEEIRFGEALLKGMLGFLLFAGALHVHLEDLSRQKWIIAALATVGVVFCTFVIGTATWYLLAAFGIEMPFIYALLFGALISPTDPIAVLGILKRAGAPKTLETKITGESLFNDGVGVVVFLALLSLVGGGHGEGAPDAFDVAWLFTLETVGGAILGMAAGYLAYRMLKTVDEYPVEILISLALVFGTYALASSWHMSGPIAVVIAGLLIGNQGRSWAMSERTREHLDTFWELVDEILNALLFLLLGLEILIITYSGPVLIVSLIAIPLVLLARLISVSITVSLFNVWRGFTRGAIRVMTWAGLRGGISVALALSLPVGPERDVILTMTYVVVVFSILVQGLTVGPLVRRVVIDVPDEA